MIITDRIHRAMKFVALFREIENQGVIWNEEN